MRKALAAAILAQASMLASDPSLLGLVMPDARVVAGVQVEQARLSPLGQYVLARMQPDDAGFKALENGLSEIVIASSAATDVTSHWLTIARGKFDAVNIPGAAAIAGGAQDSVIAFADNSTAFIGEPGLVKAALARFHAQPSPAPFAERLQPLSAAYDFWFLTSVPLSEFSAALPDANIGQAMKGNMFQSISRASGGIKFGANVQFAIRAVTGSEKDAQALMEVVRFIAGLIQGSKDKQVSTLMDRMNLSAAGNVMNLSLSVPEPQVERILLAPAARK